MLFRNLPRSRELLLPALALAGCAAAPEDGELGSSESSSTGPAPTSTVDPASSSAPETTQTETGGATTSTSADASSDESAESSGSSGAPVETMPVFVALADGGWTASSCDRGLTWTTNAFSDEQGDHTQWTGFGGLAYGGTGNGANAFVAGLGWGSEGGHILRSVDGRSWEDLPADSFVEDGAAIGYAIYTSGVAAIASELMIFSQRVWSSQDGDAWTSVDVSLPPGAEQLRQLRGFPEANLLVASVESQSGSNHPQGHFVVTSDDGGATWNEGTGYTSSCSDPVQHWGDVELVGDTLLVGTGDVCRSLDRGATWELVAMPTGEAIQDLFHDDEGFLAVSGSRIFRSADGAAWSELGDAGVPLRAAAWADGAYAAVSTMGTTLVHSDDAITWSAGTVDDPAPVERWVRDFIGVAIEGECVTR